MKISLQGRLILFFILFSTFAFGQTTIWSEDFSGYGIGVQTGAGSGISTATWSTNDGDVDIRTVSGNKLLQGKRTRNTSARWTTNPISISGYTNVQFSLDVGVSASLDFGQDFFIIAYRIDGGSYVEIENASGDTSPFDPIQSSYTVTGLSGSTIEFRITFYNNRNNGLYTIDNILVQGVVAIDTDGDGVSDDVDLDDDNDGITDEEEYCTTANVSFFASSYAGVRTDTFTHTDTGYLKLDFTSIDNSFQLDINGTGIHNSILEFENGALGGGEVYIRFQSDNAFISAPWVANVNGLPRVRVIIRETGSVEIYGTRTNSSTSLEPMIAQGGVAFNTINWVSGATNTFVITNQDGPGPESLNGTLLTSAICDSDGDGVINSLDLDSDNDGIYDIIETGVLNVSGVNDSNNDGIIDGVSANFGSNGLFSSIEDNDFEYANLTYSVSDSDSDGTYDSYELDADGDTCNDVDEAGYTDANGDGILGNTPVIINTSNGLVIGTSVVDGYTTPLDIDSNSILDFQQDNTPIITTEPIDITVCLNDDAVFTIVTNDDTNNEFQWQVDTGGGYVDISGETASSYTVLNVALADVGNKYRVLITYCNTVASAEAELSVYTITNTITTSSATFNCATNFNYIGANYPSGGLGGYTYQWQSSLDGVSWADISGATSIGYNSGLIITTTHFRRIVTSDSCTDVSAPIIFTIDTNGITDNTITTSSASYSCSTSQYISANAPTGGYLSTYTYQWQSSLDGTTWADIPGATNQGVSSGTITKTTHYRRIAYSQTCTDTSSPIILTIEDTTAPIASNPSAVVVYCPSDIPAANINVVTDEADNCTVSPTVTHIGDVTDGGSNPEIITRTYRITDDGGNSIDVAQTITINLVAITSQPSNQNVIAGNNGIFSVTAINTDTYQWQVSTNGGVSFNDISDGTDYSGTQTTTLTVSSVDIDKNSYVFRVNISNSGSISCSPITSSEVVLTISVGTVITNRRITYRVNKN